MTLDEALQFADVCDEALKHHKPIFDGPVKVISVLAAEVRRLRALPEPLTDEQVCEIAKPFVAVIGGHWENDYGIHERSVEDFARAIEKAHGIGAGE